MRKALIIGIDYYDSCPRLRGCVNDAFAMKNVLERDSDGVLNFGVKLMTASDASTSISRRDLKEQVSKLFSDDVEIAFFYFSGHGYIESTGGYIIASDCKYGDDGFPMDELLTLANTSKAKNKVIVLDCCHSGAVGSPVLTESKALLTEGLTILTASAENQYSMESEGSGVFTSLFVDALNGSAANLVGDITPGSVYAHIDQSLGPWEQRPIFKTNVRKFISLRKVQSPIALQDLKRLTELFPTPDHIFDLDPTFEPTSQTSIDSKTELFAVLQKYNRINLVKPTDEEHMYFAAMNSKSCRLTVLGVHYWNLVHKNRI
jgi:hypothetical protein